uniref:Putative ATPase domain containing protein n=1 Tax=viral metagenome TaxID=1070528 RepID=A0A6M3JH62_9ZZZZ
MKGYTPTELIQWTPPLNPYIIGSDILLQQGTLMVYGREETWKSMLIGLDMAFKIATGQPWFGYNTIASPIYIFQTEIPQAPLRKRMIKYMSGNKTTSNQIWYSSELYMKLDKGWGYAELEKEIIRTQPKVLIIDPIFSSMSGKLVDDYDVGLFLDRMDMLRSKYKLAIIMIHHTRIAEHNEGQAFHYGADEIFGSSRWPRWMDSIIFVDKISDDESTGLVHLDLTFEKTRHTEAKLPQLHIVARRSDLVFSVNGNKL